MSLSLGPPHQDRCGDGDRGTSILRIGAFLQSLSPGCGCSDSNLWAQEEDGVQEAPRSRRSSCIPGVAMRICASPPHIHPVLSVLWLRTGGDRFRRINSYLLPGLGRGADTELIPSRHPLSRAWEPGPWNFLSGV